MFLIILNLFILESLLSIDNAAVLAVMVKNLPPRQQKKALRYGLGGAYFFRGLCLLIASYLIKIIWLKIVGGLYLIYLVYGHYTKANDTIEEASSPKDSRIFKVASRIGLNQFWATIILVEIMDLAFSLDNVFAAVALTDNFYLIMAGVFMGILAMRVVAGWFVTMLAKYPSLEDSAFVVIALLGLKLVLTGVIDYTSLETARKIMESHLFDLAFSGVMMLIFFVPLLSKSNRTKYVIQKN